MRILFLTPDLPLPADRGAKLRASALIRAAAAHHEVHLLSLAANEEAWEGAQQPAPGPPSLHELKRLCQRVQIVERPPQRAALRRAASLFFDPMPDIAHRLESHGYRAALWDLLDDERYHVVQIEGLEMMPYLAAVRSARPESAIVYDAHNAEMALQRTMFQAELRDPRRWHAGLYSMAQWSKLGSYERIMMNQADVVLAVSEADASKLRGRHVQPELVPNGVDTAALEYREPRPETDGTLLFVGPLDYRPNSDAVGWFARQVLPRIRASTPARLRVVGAGSERARGEGVDAVGYVEDFGPELGRADVMVVPMRMGGGVRFKVLEAMAAGVPVVSTPLGLQGVAADHERHVLVARTAEEFASATVRVLRDRELAKRLAAAARRLVVDGYDWARITPRYLALLSRLRRTRR